MAKIFIAQDVTDGPKASFEPPDDGWTLEQIEAAERGDKDVFDDACDRSLHLVEAEAFVIVVTWDEPEAGLNVHGVYGDARAAHADWDRISEEYMNEGELPEDVEYRVEPVAP